MFWCRPCSLAPRIACTWCARGARRSRAPPEDASREAPEGLRCVPSSPRKNLVANKKSFWLSKKLNCRKKLLALENPKCRKTILMPHGDLNAARCSIFSPTWMPHGDLNAHEAGRSSRVNLAWALAMYLKVPSPFPLRALLGSCAVAPLPPRKAAPPAPPRR